VGERFDIENIEAGAHRAQNARKRFKGLGFQSLKRSSEAALLASGFGAGETAV
jgi:hypothetical protein